MCKPAPVRLTDEIFLFPRCRETLNTLIYRRSYGATFIGKHCSIRDSPHTFSNSRYDESDVRHFFRYVFFERGKSRRKFINTTKISDHLRYWSYYYNKIRIFLEILYTYCYMKMNFRIRYCTTCTILFVYDSS